MPNYNFLMSYFCLPLNELFSKDLSSEGLTVYDNDFIAFMFISLMIVFGHSAVFPSRLLNLVMA